MTATATRRRTTRRFPGKEHYEVRRDEIIWVIENQAYQQGLTIEELTAKAGIHPSTWYYLVSGKTQYPRLDTLWKLCNAAGLEVRPTTTGGAYVYTR